MFAIYHERMHVSPVLGNSFASPEVLRGERYGGRETDVWALGVLGYVILCGEVGDLSEGR